MNDFETHRPQLVRLAYGMVGSRASAEDIVQEAWIRFDAAAELEHPAAWLRTVVTRLALDELKSARVRREAYVGPWLPEPVPSDSQDPMELREALSMATLVVLEQLTPAERAAFLLREGFDLDYREIARLLERSEPATRQLVRRARSHIDAERVRFETTRDAHMALLLALGHAMQTGDLEALQRHLAADVRFVSDGGGKAAAALKPVHGATAVGRLLIGLHQKFGAAQTHVPRTLNGQPGVVTVEGERVVAAVIFCIAAGRVTAVYSVRNPDKLAAL